jgi:pimeloyl-ACP methyl ester carboxylesterase
MRHSRITVGGSNLHVVEDGDPTAPVVLFLHGWPESWAVWQGVMALAAKDHRAIAIDLPGVGESTGDPTDGSKAAIAGVVHGLVDFLELRGITLVGHDAGGMAAYAYLRRHADPAADRIVIMDTVVPGVEPWTKVLANPYIWHFAFHRVPVLPETVVSGRERPYFDYFYDVLTPDPSRISPEARETAAAAYGTMPALTAGFSWYRSFPADAEDNADTSPVGTPLRYLRGELEGGDIDEYERGFRAAGLTNVTTALIPGSGHFPMLEDPGATWSAIRDS